MADFVQQQVQQLQQRMSQLPWPGKGKATDGSQGLFGRPLFTPPAASISIPDSLRHLHHLSGLASGNKTHVKMSVPNFSGTWIKDKHASSSMEEAMNLVQLNGLVRQAVKLMRGVKIQQDSEKFTMAVFSFLTWFKVVETYLLNGEPSFTRRRDLRRGKAKGSVKCPSHSQSLVLDLAWDAPVGGTGQDVFTLPSKDVLHIESTINVDGKTAKYLTVYNRKE